MSASLTSQQPQANTMASSLQRKKKREREDDSQASPVNDQDNKAALRRLKELLSRQLDAPINSGRPVKPKSAYVCFCLAKQHSIRRMLLKEKPEVTVSIFLADDSSANESKSDNSGLTPCLFLFITFGF